MEPNSQSDPEQLVTIWDSILPYYSITVDDVCNPKPCFLIGALSEIFQLLGIDRDSILNTKLDGPEDNHSEYYADLIPAINVTRALNHLLESFHGNTCLFDVVYPRSKRVLSFLRLLTNLVLVMTQQQEAINDRIQKLYERRDEIDRLNMEKNLLLNKVNEAVAAKASRSGRMRKVNDEAEILLVKLREETALRNKELAVIQLEKKNDEEEAKINLIKKENDALEEQAAKKQTQILPNAVDLKIKREQVAREEKELSEILESKKSVLWIKKNTAANLDAVNEIFQEAINFLDNIMSVQESIKNINAVEEAVETKTKVTEEDLILSSNDAKTIQDENVKLEEQYQIMLQEKVALMQAAQNGMKQTESQHTKTANSKVWMEEYKQKMLSKRMSYESKRQSLIDELTGLSKRCSEKLAEIEDLLTGDITKCTTQLITKLHNLFDGNK